MPDLERYVIARRLIISQQHLASEDGSTLVMSSCDLSDADKAKCGNDLAPINPTPIMIQAVLGDGLTLQSTATTIFDNDGAGDTGWWKRLRLSNLQTIRTSCFSAGGATRQTATRSITQRQVH